MRDCYVIADHFPVLLVIWGFEIQIDSRVDSLQPQTRSPGFSEKNYSISLLFSFFRSSFNRMKAYRARKKASGIKNLNEATEEQLQYYQQLKSERCVKKGGFESCIVSIRQVLMLISFHRSSQLAKARVESARARASAQFLSLIPSTQTSGCQTEEESPLRLVMLAHNDATQDDTMTHQLQQT